MELTLERLRQMGGQAVLKKYGSVHFSKLGKISAEKKRRLLNKSEITPQIILDLRNKNLSYQEIGKKLGISRQRVHQILKDSKML